MALHVSPYVAEQAGSRRSLEQARAERRRSGLRHIGGDTNPLYLNVFLHRTEQGRSIGRSYEEFGGSHARASAAEEARARDAEDDGRCRYHGTLRLNPDGSFDVLDLTGRM